MLVLLTIAHIADRTHTVITMLLIIHQHTRSLRAPLAALYHQVKHHDTTVEKQNMIAALRPHVFMLEQSTPHSTTLIHSEAITMKTTYSECLSIACTVCFAMYICKTLPTRTKT